MSGEAVQVIADALRDHRLYEIAEGRPFAEIQVGYCVCGGWRARPKEFAEHLAYVVDSALGGLTRETGNKPEWFETDEMIPNPMVAGPDMVPERGLRFIPCSRWVSGWTPQEPLSAPLPSPGGTHTNPTTSGAPRAAGAAETTQGQQP